ncbi:hypothetical protein [Prescottella equi]|uniref:hypothetical protein n=1 Tax=Rhodococcus hoagii TaxID=43767 RepID=UPI001980086C|nr:hypothetical protein [Prescottella equi]
MTDTINTLADPGSDPAHEWARGGGGSPDEVDRTSLPAGIAWRREGKHVVGRVIVVRQDGKREHIATVRYENDADAALALDQMLTALGSRS